MNDRKIVIEPKKMSGRGYRQYLNIKKWGPWPLALAIANILPPSKLFRVDDIYYAYSALREGRFSGWGGNDLPLRVMT